MSCDAKERIRELERKIAAVCARCPDAKWLIGRFQCTVGRGRCHNSRVRRWLAKIKRLEAENG
ncbi:hypothetical protein ES708_29035 [subsurface metagenome]